MCDHAQREGFAGEALCSEGFDVSMGRDGTVFRRGPDSKTGGGFPAEQGTAVSGREELVGSAKVSQHALQYLKIVFKGLAAAHGVQNPDTGAAKTD